eukprot:m.143108 g.143108  ORF g.143108 m.143108 type:complete len:780 (+) comp24205_c0_seq1:130-2469(+)
MTTQQGPTDTNVKPQSNGISEWTKKNILNLHRQNTSSLDQYEIGETLGVGTHGEVKKAKHIESGQYVAIKYIDTEDCAEGRTGWSEITALKKLNHPNVVRILDVLKTSNNTCIVLECLQGGELFDYLVSRTCLKEREALIFVKQLMSALEHCHSRGVIHRDLKLENLLLDKDHNVKITDFGFSNAFNDGGLLSTFVGSPSYAAPEIIANEKYCGPAADIWSLGVIVYAILTGGLPFNDDNAATNLQRITAAEYDPPAGVSPEATHFIDSILRRNPSERPSLSELWNHPWITQLSNEYGPNTYPRLDVKTSTQDKVFAKMDDLGYEREEVLSFLKNETTCATTALYYLMLEAVSEEEKEEAKNAEIQARIAGLMNLMGGGCATPGGKKPKTRNLFMFSTPPRRPRGVTVSGIPSRQNSSTKLSPEIESALQNARRKSSMRSEEHPASPMREQPPPEEDPTTPQHTQPSMGTFTPTTPMAPLELDNTLDESATDDVFLPNSRERSSTWTCSPRQSHDYNVAGTSLKRESWKTDSTRLSSPSSQTDFSPELDMSQTVDALPRGSKSDDCTSQEETTTVVRRRPGSRRRAGRRPMTSYCEREGSSTSTTRTDRAERAERALSMTYVPTPISGFESGLGAMMEEEDEQPAGVDQTLDLATSMRSFGAATTSSLSPAEIQAEIIQVLEKNGVGYSSNGRHKLLCECRSNLTSALAKQALSTRRSSAEPRLGRRRSSLTTDSVVVWEMEICLLAQLGLHGIRLHRISGDPWRYKDMLSLLISEMKL